MNSPTPIKRLLLAAAVASACSLAGAPSASAKTWACGNGNTCHDLPCTAGETELPNGDGPNGEYNYPHCVAALRAADSGAVARSRARTDLGVAPTCKAGETAVTRNGKTTCAKAISKPGPGGAVMKQK